MLWEPLCASFARHEVVLPIADMKTVMLEFYSVLHHCRKVQQLSQRMHSFVSLEVYFDLLALYTSVLDPNQPLLIVDPTA